MEKNIKNNSRKQILHNYSGCVNKRCSIIKYNISSIKKFNTDNPFGMRMNNLNTNTR